MSSPLVRRIILLIIRRFQAVGRTSAFLFRLVKKPLLAVERALFHLFVLPIYQVIHRLKRVKGRERSTIGAMMIRPSLGIVLIVLGGIGGIAFNLSTPTTAQGEPVGQQTILFLLSRDETFAADEETVVVTRGKRAPAYYTREPHDALWRLTSPAPFNDPQIPLQTTYGGSTLIALPTTPPPPRLQTTENRRREPMIYMIRPGDTLSTIAQKFGISVETILWENNLRVTALLRIGQKLTILPTTGISHRVLRGETLATIARRYGVTIEEIRQQNNLALNQPLTIGATLTIPGARQQRTVIIQRPLSSLRTFRDIAPPSSPRTTIPSRLFWPTTSRKLNQYFTWRHAGIDIDGDYTSPIYAADDGVVTVSGWGVGYGIYIDIDHGNGMKTRYGHNSKNFVRVGEKVKRGQLIGMIGSTGRSTGPHVHFEVIVGGRRMNPLNYVR